MKKRLSKKTYVKRISAVLIAALILCLLPAEPSYGLLSPLSQVGVPAKVTTFKSTADTDAEEYLRAYVTTADDHVLKVIYRTPLETSLFRLSLYRVGENKGDIGLDIFIAPTMARTGNGTETYNFTYYLNMDEYEIEDGYYNIYIRRCATAEDAASLYDTGLYLDNSLEDIRFVLRNPATGVYSSITAAKQSYIRSVANRITAGITADYEKLRAISWFTATVWRSLPTTGVRSKI